MFNHESGVMQRRAGGMRPEQGRDERGPATDHKP